MAQERLEVRFSPTNAEENEIIKALEALTEYGAKGRFLKARLLRGYVFMMREMESIKAESDPLAALDRVAQSMDSGTYYALRAMLYPPNADLAGSGHVKTPVSSSGVPAGRPVEPIAVEALPVAPEAAPAALQVEPHLQRRVAAVGAPEPVFVAPDAIVSAVEEPTAPIQGEIVAADAQPSAVSAAEPAVDIGAATPFVSEVTEAVSDVSIPEPVDAAAGEPSDSASDNNAPAPTPAPKAAPAHNWQRFAGIAGTRGGG